jgi:hypothetical protein
MKYTIYEDPITHRFTHLALPSRFLEGDELPAVVTDRWFETHDAALAGLGELLDREDRESQSIADAALQPDAGIPPSHPPRPFVWFQH